MKTFKVLNHPVINSFKVILGGNILTQLVGLATYGILARRFSTESFGVSGLVLSLAFICSIPHTGQIYWSLFREHEEKLLVSHYEDSLNFTFLMTPFLLIIAVAGALCNFKDLGWLIILVPIFSLTYSLLEINKTYLNSQGEYKSTVKQTFYSRSYGQLLKIVFSFISKGPISLVLGEVFGNLIIIFKMFKNISLDKLSFKIFGKHKKTIFYYTPINLFNLLIQEMPLLLASYIYGFEQTGAYFLLNRLIISPMTLIGNSYGSSQVKKMSSLRTRPGDKAKFLIKSYASLLTIGLIPSVIIYFWGYELFNLFLGSGHEEAAKLSVVIAFLLPFRLIKALGIISSVNSDLHKETLALRSIQVGIICLIPFFFKEMSFQDMVLTVLSLDTLVDIVLAIFGIVNTSKKVSVETVKSGF